MAAGWEVAAWVGAAKAAAGLGAAERGAAVREAAGLEAAAANKSDREREGKDTFLLVCWNQRHQTRIGMSRSHVEEVGRRVSTQQKIVAFGWFP